MDKTALLENMWSLKTVQRFSHEVEIRSNLRDSIYIKSTFDVSFHKEI